MIIAIEGVNSVGKTTLLNQLIKDRQYAGVAEVSTMLPGALSFPLSASHARANEQFIAGIEYARIKAAHAIQALGKLYVVLDRSIISTLVLSLSHSLLRGWNKNSIHLLKECLHENFAVSLLPHVIVHLDIDETLLAPRHLSRSNKLSDKWTDTAFIATQQKYYATIYAFLQENHFCQVIHADAARNPQEVHADICSRLPAIEYTEQHKHAADFFKWLINDIA